MKKGIEQESRQASKHKEKRKRRTHHSGAGGTAARRRGRITIALALRAGRNGGKRNGGNAVSRSLSRMGPKDITFHLW